MSKSRLRFIVLPVACFFAPALLCLGQTLPDGPPPPPLGPQPATPPTHVLVPAVRPATPEEVKRRQWSGVVEPGEKIPALTVHEKLLFAAHEEFRWSSLFAASYSGGYGVLRNNDPHFGTNSEGFGERVGAATLRQSINRELADSLLPIAFHEDPRYYRQAYGTYQSRGIHALLSSVIAHTDSGGTSIDWSDILGRGMNAALTQTYYPQSSIGPRVVFSSWGISLSQLAGYNIVQEFWPDAKRKFFHKSR